MSTLSVRLPASLHRQLRDLARRERVSMNQLISAAVGEKLAALLTADYLRERAQRGRRSAYLDVLARVPDVAPADPDVLPPPARKQSKTARKQSALPRRRAARRRTA